MSDATPKAERDARERCIATIVLPGLNNDELRVLEVIGLRMLRIGRETHGPLDLSRERRDWRTEGALELADRIFYDACEEIARNDERLERLRCEAADEIACANPVEAGLRELSAAAPTTTPDPIMQRIDDIARVIDEQQQHVAELRRAHAAKSAINAKQFDLSDLDPAIGGEGG